MGAWKSIGRNVPKFSQDLKFAFQYLVSVSGQNNYFPTTKV